MQFSPFIVTSNSATHDFITTEEQLFAYASITMLINDSLKPSSVNHFIVDANSVGHLSKCITNGCSFGSSTNSLSLPNSKSYQSISHTYFNDHFVIESQPLYYTCPISIYTYW